MIKKAWAGFEPAYSGFADRCLPTWLPGHIIILPFFFFLSKFSESIILQREKLNLIFSQVF